MYLPKHFEQHDAAELARLMREHPLATLVTTAADGTLTADHVPLEHRADDSPHGVLRGHVARANPLWQHAAGKPVLAVFNGPQAYVSPSWYPGKQEHHKVVPTWNYAVVHVSGVLHAVEDAPWLHGLVSGLTGTHEAARPAPWAVTDAPEDFVRQMLRAIVGIEIRIDAVTGKWKLSQNRSAADKAGTVAGLATGDAAAQATAAWMSPLR